MSFRILIILALTILSQSSVYSRNNEITDICEKADNCFFHFWAVGGNGHKCQVTLNQFEEKSCTIKCKNITSRMYCNAESRKCEWVDRKDANGNDDSVCKRKTELKTFMQKPPLPKKPKAKRPAADGAVNLPSDGETSAAPAATPKAKRAKKEKAPPAEGGETATPKKSTSFGFGNKKPAAAQTR